MGKIKIIILVFCSLCWWRSVSGQFVLEDYPVLEKTTQLRLKLVEVAESQLGILEKTGNNDGPEIKKYLRAVGLPEGYAYCAAGMAWCHEQLNIPNPLSAWSPDWFRGNLVFLRHEPRITPFVSRKGQVAGLYYEALHRIAHMGMIVDEFKGHYIMVEFNTSANTGSREGEGVFVKIRKKETIEAVADYVGIREMDKKWKDDKQSRKRINSSNNSRSSHGDSYD